MPPEKTLQNGPTAPPPKKQKLFASSDPHHPLPPWLLSSSSSSSQDLDPRRRGGPRWGRTWKGHRSCGRAAWDEADVFCHALLWYVLFCHALFCPVMLCSRARSRPTAPDDRIAGSGGRGMQGGGVAGGSVLRNLTTPTCRVGKKADVFCHARAAPARGAPPAPRAGGRACFATCQQREEREGGREGERRRMMRRRGGRI